MKCGSNSGFRPSCFAFSVSYRSLTQESKEELISDSLYYTDVQSGQWYSEAITALTKAGIFAGCGDNLFCPNGIVTEGQLVTVLVRFVDVEEENIDVPAQNQSWAYRAIQTAYTLNWIESPDEVEVDRPLTRFEAVSFVNSILEGESIE